MFYMISSNLQPLIRFCLTLIFVVSLGSAYAMDTLKISISEYPPHVKRNVDGYLEGKLVEYLKLGYSSDFKKVEFVPLLRKRGLLEVQKGKVDLHFPYITPISNVKNIGSPLFHANPGICFKKSNFVPFLSAPNALNGRVIGVAAGTNVVEVLTQYKDKVHYIEGVDAITRGTALLLKGRIDALYHKNPENIYHYDNPLSKSIACSYFHGYSEAVHLAVSPAVSKQHLAKIRLAFERFNASMPYEFFDDEAKQFNDLK